MQSILPDSSSISLESQAIGCALYSRPRRFATSCASSRSNPVYSPSSPTNPIGGKSWSKPTIRVPPSVVFASSAVVSSAWLSAAFVSAALLLLPHAVMESAITAASAALTNLFFIIGVLLIFRQWKPFSLCRFPSRFLICYHISILKRFCKALIFEICLFV